MSRFFRSLSSADDLTELVEEIGLIPLFSVGIEDFSVESMTQGQWWTGLPDDPWVWRETIAAQGRIVYAKLFSGHAGFISKEWFSVLLNYRRDGYDFDTRWEEGMASSQCRDIMNAITSRESALTADIKRTTGAKGFESALTQLQMQTYVILSGFERRKNRFGEPYGWSIGRITTPEQVFGTNWVQSAYNEFPKVSFQRLLDHIRTLLPGADADAIRKRILS